MKCRVVSRDQEHVLILGCMQTELQTLITWPNHMIWQYSYLTLKSKCMHADKMHTQG